MTVGAFTVGRLVSSSEVFVVTASRIILVGITFLADHQVFDADQLGRHEDRRAAPKAPLDAAIGEQEKIPVDK